MKEIELAEKFINYFNDKFEIYKEVPAYGIIDFVAKAFNIRIAVEVKTTLNFKVIEQAFNSKKYVHYVYVAIPESSNRHFAYKICEDYGIGVLLYDDKSKTIDERVKPRLNRKPIKLKLEEYMKESVAGSTNNRITAFKNTINSICRYLESNDGSLLNDVLKNVKYHWSNLSSAKSCIYQWCRRGIIKEFKFIDGRLYLNNEK